MPHARILHTTIAYDRWSTFREAQIELPNGAIEKRVVEDHGEAAAVLLYDEARRVALLVEQPRAPVLFATGAPSTLEVVAGRIEEKGVEATVRAEAMEEAGVRLGTIDHVATLWMMPAVSTERIHLYLAAYGAADRVAAGGGAADENECIVVREMPLAELWCLAERGVLTDGKTFILMQALRTRRPDLFGT